MENYSGLKRNELSSHEKAWRKLKCILLSEKSQSEKSTYCTTPTTVYDILRRQNYGGTEKINGCHGLVGREGRMNR